MGKRTVADEQWRVRRRVRRGTLLGGRYLVESAIGEGAMGSVFRAQDTRIGRPVAVKVLNGQFEAGSVATRRFMQEAQIMASLKHPGVCKVWDMGIDNESTGYLVMELLEGETLDDLLKRRTRLAEPEACSLVCQLLATLSVVHNGGVVHRDLKPANVFITSGQHRGRTKLLDFGLSQKTRANAVRITKPGVLVGTPYYMSPRLIQGGKAGARSDVYAVALALYEMLAGELPMEFDTDSVIGVFRTILKAPRRPLAVVSGGAVSLALCAVVDRAVHCEDGFESAYDLLVAIDETQGSMYRKSELARALPYASRPPA